MTLPTVRVVQYGFPARVRVTIDRPPREDGERVPREVLADDLRNVEEGMQVATEKLAERGARVGPWVPIGPNVRQAVVRGGA